MGKKLDVYNTKRNFEKTQEPEGMIASSADQLHFVVQRHDASRLHYDFRLEFDGVLWSWAVPKGPSFDPNDKRLAVHVEDHPLDYRNFEGTIPQGEYGGGTVQLFDEGIWIPKGDPKKGLTEGSLKFELQGQRLKGHWALVRMKAKEGEEDKNWLLIKEKDRHVRQDNPLTDILTSVRSGQTLEEIAQEASVDTNKSTSEIPKSSNGQLKVTSDKGKLKQPESTSVKNRVAKKPAGALPFTDATPMLATLSKNVPKGTQWIHELKFDGYRILAFIEGEDVRLLTRNGNNWSDKIPTLVDALNTWAPGNLVLDGELVVFDESGRTDFNALQAYFKHRQDVPVDYVVFDLLAYGSLDVQSLPLKERKEILESLLENSPPGIHFSYHTENGEQLFQKVCSESFEGIISKKKDAPYRQSRSKEWIKVKCRVSRNFVIGGYTVTNINSTGLSALLLGSYEGDELRYVGRAGTGFTQDKTDELLDHFKHLNRKTSPFTKTPSQRFDETLHFLTPTLLATIEFAEFTNDGLLRQASYRGFQSMESVSQAKSNSEKEHPDDRSSATGLSQPTPVTVSDFSSTSETYLESESLPDTDSGLDSELESRLVPETESSQNLKSKVGSQKKKHSNQRDQTKLNKKNKAESKPNVFGDVVLSSPEKLVFPEDGYTKQDVADYYWAIQEHIIPYLSNRPMTLIRCIEEIGEECFYQKHLNHAIGGVEKMAILNNDGDDTDVMVMHDPESLMGAIQSGAMEFHLWGSRMDHLEQPDWLVFDLDPDEGMDADQVRQGVRDLKSLLDELNLKSYLKTSGGKGYHIVIPLDPAAGWDSCAAFAKLIAQGMESKWPDRYTANMRKDKRKGRIYVDWVRNRRSATSIANFSLRARKGAPISWPLRWSDLEDYLPHSVNLSNWKNHLKTLDGWTDFHQANQRLK